jgi:hypothetical protein
MPTEMSIAALGGIKKLLQRSLRLPGFCAYLVNILNTP